MELVLDPKFRWRICYNYFDVCVRTMLEARSIIEAMGQEGMIYVTVAGHQTGGRGRMGRQWLSGEGNIFMSIGFCHGGVDLEGLVLSFSVLVRRVLGAIVPVFLKWPNDIYGKKGKISGALLEQAGSWCVLGLGINTQEAPLSYVSSLAQEGAQVPANDKIVADLVEAFVEWLDRGQRFKDMREEWLDHALYLGERVRVDSGGRAPLEGVFQGVDVHGRACILCHDGPYVCASGGMRPVRP